LPTLGTNGVAHCHLTRGANRSGDGSSFGDAIKTTAVVDIVLGPNDKQDWTFNFLQFANLMVRESLWGGRTDSEGSIKINYAIAPAFPTNPSLESDAKIIPFMLGTGGFSQTQVQQGANTRITLTRVVKDHPNSKQGLQRRNFKTNCPNFLRNMRLDLEL